MTTLRKHLTVKLSDPEFRANYSSWCEACPRTMEIIGRVHAAKVTVQELACQIDIEPEKLTAFLDAEHCEYEVMTRLCAHFGVTPPEDCAQMRSR
jgi:hypothetical protein